MIYADNAATTALSELAFERMLPFLREQYGNASSQYSFGATAKRAVEQAREQVAAVIGAEPPEVVFTSGGSEGNSMVLRGVRELYRGEQMHVITSAVEHSSVLNACRALEWSGVEVTRLPVDGQGRVSAEAVFAAIRPDTRLVSIMLANNEIGTLQPVSEIGRLLCGRDILLHTDAVQAVGHIPVNVLDLNVDFLTASAHKFGGPKGIGFLYMRSGLSLPPLVYGGEQERGRRAGTENVAGIVAMGYALEESARDMAKEEPRLRALTEATVRAVRGEIPSARVHGGTDSGLPGIVSLGFNNVSGEALLHLLDMKGICVSTSSACSSGNGEPSHVLLAIGLSEQEAKSSIRVSYGRHNTAEDAGIIARAICDIVLVIKNDF